MYSSVLHAADAPSPHLMRRILCSVCQRAPRSRPAKAMLPYRHVLHPLLLRLLLFATALGTTMSNPRPYTARLQPHPTEAAGGLEGRIQGPRIPTPTPRHSGFVSAHVLRTPPSSSSTPSRRALLVAWREQGRRPRGLCSGVGGGGGSADCPKQVKRSRQSRKRAAASSSRVPRTQWSDRQERRRGRLRRGGGGGGRGDAQAFFFFINRRVLSM